MSGVFYSGLKPDFNFHVDSEEHVDLNKGPEQASVPTMKRLHSQVVLADAHAA